MSPATDAFIPDAEQVLAHIRAWMPRPRQRGRTLAVLAAAALGVVIAVLVLPPVAAALVPWLAIGGFVAWVLHRKTAAAKAQRGIASAHELTALRQPREAIGAAWAILPRLKPWPELHVRAVMLLAANLMRVRAFDAAAHAHDYLLEHIPRQHPAGLTTQLQRIMALLQEHRLADADDALRALPRTELPPISEAMRRLAELYRQVKTNNLAEAREQIEADGLVDALQPLGADGGLGYAMAAVVCDLDGDADQAETWWRRATRLIAPHALAYHLPEAARMLDRPAAPTLDAAMREDGLA
jgi:tetratricopeptide (TPR) repeat protein